MKENAIMIAFLAHLNQINLIEKNKDNLIASLMLLELAHDAEVQIKKAATSNSRDFLDLGQKAEATIKNEQTFLEDYLTEELFIKLQKFKIWMDEMSFVKEEHKEELSSLNFLLRICQAAIYGQRRHDIEAFIESLKAGIDFLTKKIAKIANENNLVAGNHPGNSEYQKKANFLRSLRDGLAIKQKTMQSALKDQRFNPTVDFLACHMAQAQNIIKQTEDKPSEGIKKIIDKLLETMRHAFGFLTESEEIIHAMSTRRCRLWNDWMEGSCHFESEALTHHL